MRQIRVGPAPPSRVADVLLPERAQAFLALAEKARRLLADRVVWNISSTAGGGGVAEMLQGFLRYVLGAGVDCRWVVLDGTPEFFEVTKRLHNRLHGARGDGGALGDTDRQLYAGVVDSNAADLVEVVRAGDIVILHDPQAIGLARGIRGVGAPIVWRCHIGTDLVTAETDEAWTFLRPWVEDADATVFSRASYAPAWLDPAKVTVIAPAIDPLSPKNQELTADTVLAILGRAGIVAADGGSARFFDAAGRWRSADCRAEVVREGERLGPAVPILLQVSRWDRLKDMAGVLSGFVAGRVAEDTGAHLLLVGPDVSGVTDDPEGRQVLDECVAVWRALPAGRRRQASLVTLAMNDLEQNAAVVNALQRHAAVVTQKSLKEGFGLTVAEAMWKSRPVVASAVGGIQDQVRNGQDGLLLADPRDGAAFAAAVHQLLADPTDAARMGRNAHVRVRDNFLADRDLTQWTTLIEQVIPG